MRLVENGKNWRIEGQGKERARVANASKKGGQLVFTLSAQAGEETRSMSQSG